jgi:hypothetical protein
MTRGILLVYVAGGHGSSGVAGGGHGSLYLLRLKVEPHIRGSVTGSCPYFTRVLHPA